MVHDLIGLENNLVDMSQVSAATKKDTTVRWIMEFFIFYSWISKFSFHL